jgi:SAM-dependent methyltransferase
MTDSAPLPAFPAAEQWAARLAGWGIPPEIEAHAPEPPWGFDAGRFDPDPVVDRASVSARWGREVLPALGGTVLDVGCGGGRASLALVPPASELIGVDTSGAMLDGYLAAAAAVGVARRTIHGEWPEIANLAPVADVVVCHHVVYNVVDVAPFLAALSRHARLAVVLEMPTVHPMAVWAPAWRHFWNVERPAGPTADDLVAVLRELGLDPEVATSPRPIRRSDRDGDPGALVRTARRRLCLTADRDGELAEWLAAHPPSFADTMATIRWPGD